MAGNCSQLLAPPFEEQQQGGIRAVQQERRVVDVAQHQQGALLTPLQPASAAFQRLADEIRLRLRGGGGLQAAMALHEAPRADPADPRRAQQAQPAGQLVHAQGWVKRSPTLTGSCTEMISA
jgi:hypothetical protein